MIDDDTTRGGAADAGPAGGDTPRPPGARNGAARQPGGRAMKCEEILPVLFDYMARELGPARSDLVRGHLLKCESCRQAAADIQATVSLLQTAAADRAAIPEHLSEERRRRLWRAYTHPVLDWMFEHHIAVSVLATLAALGVVLYLAWRVTIWRIERLEMSPPVWIDGHGLDEQVLRQFREEERTYGVSNAAPRPAGE